MRLDAIQIDLLRRAKGVEDRRLRDLIEQRPNVGIVISVDAFENRVQIVSDRLPFSIVVGGKEDDFGRLGGIPQLLDALVSLGDKLRLEPLLDVNAQIVLWEVAHMSLRGEDLVALVQILAYGPGFGR